MTGEPQDIEAKSVPDGEAVAPVTEYRDINYIDKAKAAARDRRSLRKYPAESISAYLARLGTRGQMRDPNDSESRLDLALRKVALPLGMLTYNASSRASAVRARALNSGYRYCPCTDVKRLANSFKADPASNMTLAELQKSASGKKACKRCWLISESISKFDNSWAGIPSNEVLVTGGPDLVLGSGSIAVFTVFWVSIAMRELKWEEPKWSKAELEAYFEEGGYQLYPNMQPRKKFLADINADRSVQIISMWIERCISKHIFCNEKQATPFLPMRLVDVGSGEGEDVRLVDGAGVHESGAKYGALSYSWGHVADRVHPIPTTETVNIEDRKLSIPWEEFTPVAKDAIAFVRALNLRYIWIDSLCVIQDDPKDFAYQASQMASIYGEAYIVISATRSPSSDTGLFQHRTEPLTISHVDSEGEVSQVRIRRQIEHEDYVTGEPRQFTGAPLFSRAWCFQERLLARRIVHFGEHEIVFECKEGLECECGMMFSSDGIYHNFKVSSAYGLVKSSPKDRYRTWYSVLRPYTSRSLTFESDRLPALSGFARLVSIPEMGQYFAGLWQNELPGGLLWRVVRALPAHQGRIDRPSPYRAPTWSWAGIQAVVEGHVQFHAGIEPVAKVQDIYCKPSSLDAFGEVQSGYLVLQAPTVQVTLRTRQDGSELSERSYLLARNDESSDHIHFEADLTVTIIDSNIICVGIEHDTVGVHRHRWSSLVLQRDISHDHYYRIGIIECPTNWLSNEQTDIVTIH